MVSRSTRLYSRFVACGPLDVVSQQVVDIDTEAADGRHLFQASMRTVPVVLVRPGGELGGPFCGVFVSSGVGPFVDCGFDKALRLTVGARSVDAGSFVGDAEVAASMCELERVEAWAVVGEHAPGGHAEALEPGDGLCEEGG